MPVRLLTESNRMYLRISAQVHSLSLFLPFFYTHVANGNSSNFFITTHYHLSSLCATETSSVWRRYVCCDLYLIVSSCDQMVGLRLCYQG